MNYIPSHLQTKEIKKDKEELIAQGYPHEKVVQFVKTHLYVPAYREALVGKDNVFLVMPSTSGKNVIPEYMASRLQKEYGGTIVIDYALPKHETKSAYMGAISKLREPRQYLLRQEPFRDMDSQRKNIIIVDDVVTSGSSVNSLAKSLAEKGIEVDTVVSLAQSDKRLVTERDIERLSGKLQPINGDYEKTRRDVELVFGGQLKHALNTVEREITGAKKSKYREIAYEYVTREAERIRNETSMDRRLQSGQERKTELPGIANDRDKGVSVREEQRTYEGNSKSPVVGDTIADLQKIARHEGYPLSPKVIATVADELNNGRFTFDELREAMMIKIGQMKNKDQQPKQSKSEDVGLSL
jgi:hypoxanthine phosphoribosyltransferase